jgi:NAD(P)H-quinone oxidoreductase subunit 4
MNYFPWLTVIVLLPVTAALIIPFLPSFQGNHLIRWYALGVSLLDLILMTYIFESEYHLFHLQIQLRDDYPCMSVIDFHWRLGVDGLSISLMLLTGFVTTLSVLAAWPLTCNPKLFYFLMLAMYSGQLGLFSSQDMLLFFVMWELELVPVYLLISMWGGKRRLYAATKFILYTAGGSIFLLAGAITASVWETSIPVLEFQVLSNKVYPLGLEIVIYVAFLIAYSVKVPSLPLHTWLPDTHGEAHYSTCMLLAGILLKMGGYGFIRVNMQLLPHAHTILAPWLVIVGTIQIVYAGLVSLAQQNLKRRIAYSSISHMGFVLIGVGSFSSIGLSGAILQMVSHGLIGAGLFFLSGINYDRTQTLILNKMGGWAYLMPKMFGMFTICSMASLALPGMSGFVSELMVFVGIVTTTFYAFHFRFFVTVIESIGIIITPIYLLSMLRQVFYGTPSICLYRSWVDASPREVFVFVSLLIPMVAIGIYPEIVTLFWNINSSNLLLFI